MCNFSFVMCCLVLLVSGLKVSLVPVSSGVQCRLAFVPRLIFFWFLFPVSIWACGHRFWGLVSSVSEFSSGFVLRLVFPILVPVTHTVHLSICGLFFFFLMVLLKIEDNLFQKGAYCKVCVCVPASAGR